jgi:hypothetical protein
MMVVTVMAIVHVSMMPVAVMPMIRPCLGARKSEQDGGRQANCQEKLSHSSTPFEMRRI